MQRIAPPVVLGRVAVVLEPSAEHLVVELHEVLAQEVGDLEPQPEPGVLGPGK